MTNTTCRTSTPYLLRFSQHAFRRAACAGWLLACLLVIPRVGHAQFSYVTNNGALTLTGCLGWNSWDRVVTIPDTVNGLPVCNIGENAFGYRFWSSPVSVTIPDSVTNIGAYAFSGCPGLTSIMLSASLSNIGAYAFHGCSGLTNLTLPATLSNIGNNAFFGCSSLTSITLPASLSNIGDSAFYWCSSLTRVSIPNGVTNIGVSAFGMCSRLTSATLPASLSNIGYGTFSSCSGLTSVNIPNGVTNIGTYAFYGCTGLTNITLPASLSNIGYGAFCYCSGLTSMSIPNGVANIEASAFYRCSRLTNITLPASSTNIGAYAFGGCCSLTSVTLPASLSNIGDGAFSYCYGLTSVSIPNGVTTVGAYAFNGCSGLTNISGGEGLTSIGSSAFQACASLVNVTIPNGVTNIGDGAFAGCSSLTSVALPGSVTSIGKLAFQNCPRLRAITVDALNPAYSSVDGALCDKTQTTLLVCPAGKAGRYAIPNGVTNIDSAFSECVQLTSVTLPGSLTSLAGLPFVQCTNLQAIVVEPENPAFSSREGVLFDKSGTTLLLCPAGKSGSYTVPDGTETIGSYAFFGCRRLACMQLPNSLTNIEDEAFVLCWSLSSITIPRGVTHVGTQAFLSCLKLRKITVDALNPYYSSVGGVLFDKPQTTLVQYPPGRAGSYTIPSSVTSIGDCAFMYCDNLTSVAGGANLLSIGRSAFNDCRSLTNVAVLSGVIEIGDFAFEQCHALTAITVGPHLASLGQGAFAFCPRLTEVFFQGDAPSSVGEDVFENDDNTTVYYLSGKQGWDVSFGDRPTALWNGTYTIAVRAWSHMEDASAGGSLEGGGTFVGGQWHTVQATAGPGYVFANWMEGDAVVSTSPTYTFLLLGNRDLVANFAPKLVPALAGTYHGLIEDANAAWPGSSGCFTLRVTAQGRCSGVAQVGGVGSRFSGQVDYTGRLSVHLPVGYLELQLGWWSTPAQVSGTLSTRAWTAQVTGEQAVFNAKTQPATNYAGRYTLVFPGSSGATQAPVGDSWATLSVTPSGLVHLSAALADGTKLTQGSALFQEGVWPLYAALYQRRGMLLGWMGLANTLTTDVSGSVMWTRLPAQTKGYSEGFALTTTAAGSRYVAPAGAAVLNLTNAALVLAGPGLTQEVTSYVTLQPDSRVESTNHTRLSFNLATGTFKGSVPNPEDPEAKPISFSGVVLQKQNYGCGWFGQQNLWGEVTLGQ